MKRTESKSSPEVAVPRRNSLRVTTRPVWLLGYLAMLIVSGLRFPGLADELRDTVPADLTSSVDDPELINLAINVGVGLAAVAVAGFYALLLAACSSLDNRLVTSGIILPKGQGLGYVFTSVVLVVVSAQGWAVATGLGTGSVPVEVYVLTVVVLGAVAWAFRTQLKRLEKFRRVLVVAACTLLAVLPVIQ